MPRVRALSRPTPPLSEDALLTLGQLAEVLGLSERTIIRLRRERGLPYVELPVGDKPMIRYDTSAVRAWIGAHTRGEVPEAEPEAPVGKPHRGRPRGRVGAGGGVPR